MEKEITKAKADFTQYPLPVLDTTGFGKNITRTMYLLNSSTPEQPNRVKIAYVGQSITNEANSWPRDLTAWLRLQYPSAEIVYKNFAIGGFSTNYLYKRMPNDIASYYPDLIVCYDKGDNHYYDRMIAWIRANTTAEIMIQTDHYTGEHAWSDTMLYTHLPAIAQKYRAQLCDIRTPWKKYMLDNHLDPHILLTDGTHLNEDGQTFMLSLMQQFFVYRAADAPEALQKRLIPVTPQAWQDGKLTVTFTGNRVEVIAGDGPQHAAHVLIDGKSPSQIPAAYIRSAENRGMDSRIGMVHYNQAPGEQVFTITLLNYTDEQHLTYTVEGTQTGFEGTSDENGVLNGAYVSLTPESFTCHTAAKTPQPGDKITFQSILNGTDMYQGGNPYANGAGKDVLDANMLISGIVGGSHTLVLEAVDAIPDIKALRVYDPELF